MNCSYNTLLHFARMDKERNRCRLKAIDESQKRRRRVLKAQSIAAETSKKRKEKPGQMYKSKAFGSELTTTSLVPTTTADDTDYECPECGKHDCSKGRKCKKDDWVCCEFCDLWYHAKCMQVTIKQLGDDPFRCFNCEEQEL